MIIAKYKTKSGFNVTTTINEDDKIGIAQLIERAKERGADKVVNIETGEQIYPN